MTEINSPPNERVLRIPSCDSGESCCIQRGAADQLRFVWWSTLTSCETLSSKTNWSACSSLLQQIMTVKHVKYILSDLPMYSLSLFLQCMYANLIPKTIGNRKRDCPWGCARGINTTWENLQIEKHKSGRRSFRSPNWFVLFDLQNFSGGVYPPERNLTHNIFFYFQQFWYLVIWFIFSIFFDEKKKGAAENSIVCFAVSIPCHAQFDSAKNANGFEECNVFGNGKCELNAIKEGRN